MAGSAFSYHWEHDRIPEFTAGLKGAVERGIDDWAKELEDEAKKAAPIAKEFTPEIGALKSSGFRITPIFSDYQDAENAFLGLVPDAPTDAEPFVAPGGAVVGFLAYYAGYVHDGHHTRNGGWVAGRPWLAELYAQYEPKISRLVDEYVYRLALGVL